MSSESGPNGQPVDRDTELLEKAASAAVAEFAVPVHLNLIEEMLSRVDKREFDPNSIVKNILGALNNSEIRGHTERRAYAYALAELRGCLHEPEIKHLWENMGNVEHIGPRRRQEFRSRPL